VGRFAEAEGLCRDVVARRRKTVPPDSPFLADGLSSLGVVLLQQEKWTEAEPPLREYLAICDKALPDDVRRYEAMSFLGLALMGRHADAEPLIVAGYEEMKAREARIAVPDRSLLRAAAERVVHLYEEWGKPDRAAEWKDKLKMNDLPADIFAPP
jgi:hypothetical protein